MKIASLKQEYLHRIPDLLETVDEMHREWYPWLFRIPEDQQKRESDYQKWLDSPEFHPFVLKNKKGELEGFMLLIEREFPKNPLIIPQKFMLLDILMLTPNTRGQGWGKKMMTFAEQFSREKGFLRMELKVYGKNEAAIRFYESLGYDPLALIMSKDL